jgi:hypothetical protein
VEDDAVFAVIELAADAAADAAVVAVVAVVVAVVGDDEVLLDDCTYVLTFIYGVAVVDFRYCFFFNITLLYIFN